MFLASWGYDVSMFSDAPSCVSSLPCTDTCIFDQPCAYAMITDLWMPGMTGLSLMELLRARNCKIPRLAIMSADGRDFLPRMAGAGCAFFEKPFELSDLLSWLGHEGMRSDGRNKHG
jgi:CheY-like chemotaxis protein